MYFRMTKKTRYQINAKREIQSLKRFDRKCQEK